MKASLKLREDQNHSNQNQTQTQTQNQNQNPNPLLRAKIPISILGLPFISIITAGDPSDLSFSLRTNSFNGPSLKFSYSPNTPQNNPFSLSLKSGVGIFGSPQNSSLVMSAQFNLFGNPNPTFFLQFKPQFGDFSLKKTVVSAPLPNPNPSPNPNFPKENGGTHFNDDIGVMLERPLAWRELTEFRNGGDRFFSGVAVSAKTVLPLTKRALVKFRWGVNFPPEFGQNQKFPFLTVDKIGVERVEEKVEVNSQKKDHNGIGANVGDVEVLKGMCFWMRNEVEVLKRENRTMKESLEELSLGSPMAKNGRVTSENVTKKSVSPSTTGNSAEFERWRNRKNVGEENGQREMKKFNGSESLNSDVGEELKRAIMAASSNGV